MKKITQLLLIVITLISCSTSDDNNSSNGNMNLNSNEYVILFPLATPLNTVENNNDLFVFYKDNDTNNSGPNGIPNKLSKVDNDGNVLWTSELDFDGFPESSLAFVNGNSISFFYLFNQEFRLTQFDVDGNLLQNNLISSGSFDDIQKEGNIIHLVKHNPTNIYIEKYSLTGSLIENQTINTQIENTSSSKTIVSENFSYLFSISDFNGTDPYFYDNYYCDIYNENTLSNTISINTSNKNAIVENSLVLNNGNILFVSFFTDNIGNLKYEFELFNSTTGEQVANRSFDSSSNVIRIIQNSSGNIVFAGGYDRPNTSTKWSEFSILDSNLNMISQRVIGSLDTGEIFFEINEGQNNYYITGRTDGSTGDFDLPNNSMGTDMFLYKLNK